MGIWHNRSEKPGPVEPQHLMVYHASVSHDISVGREVIGLWGNPNANYPRTLPDPVIQCLRNRISFNFDVHAVQ